MASTGNEGSLFEEVVCVCVEDIERCGSLEGWDGRRWWWSHVKRTGARRRYWVVRAEGGGWGKGGVYEDFFSWYSRCRGGGVMGKDGHVGRC